MQQTTVYFLHTRHITILSLIDFERQVLTVKQKKMYTAFKSCPAAKTLTKFLTTITTIINIQTPQDLSSVSQIKDGEHYDFIIVGAGSAGCVLANRLSENPNWTVLLLEAGGEEPEVAGVPALLTYNTGTRLDWKYVAEKQPTSCGGKPCTFPRGKVLGGTSVLNVMAYTRGFPRDYQQWADAGNEGWDYESVLPYFKKSENNQDQDIYSNEEFHARGGYLSVSRLPYQDKNIKVLENTFKEMGYKKVDFNTKDVDGYMTIQATQENGERRSTNKAFLAPIRYNRNNLKIVTNIRVVKVLTDQEQPSAYGIEYILEKDRSVRGTILAKKEVILSAGVFNTPQILMLSGIGPNETLSSLGIKTIKNLKVGYNLQDHHMSPGVFFSLQEKSQMNPNDLNFLKDSAKYFAGDRKGSPWSGVGMGHAVLNIRTKYAKDRYPDIQMYFLPRMTCADAASPFCYYDQIDLQPLLFKPKSRGRVTINSTDPFAQPVIYPNYFQDPNDIEVYLESYKFAEKLKLSAAFKKAGFFVNTTFLPSREDFETGNNALWKQTKSKFAFSICHPSCTCKMGPAADADAVVDPQLKVYGIEKLRVVDASVMPFITSGPINAPIIMIAEKASDIIKDYWKNES